MRPEIPRFPGFIHPNVGLEAVGGFCQPSRRTPRANVWSRLERRRPDAAASMYATVAANSAWLSTTITWASEWPRASGQGTQPRVEICFLGGDFFTTLLYLGQGIRTPATARYVLEQQEIKHSQYTSTPLLASTCGHS